MTNNSDSEDFMKLYPPENDTGKEDFEMTRDEMRQIETALKDKEFRKLLSEYVDEIRDPDNQLTHQTELRQLEKERGNIIHFVNPVAGYVLKTSADGTKKAFLNICSNTLIRKPCFEVGVKENRPGSVWSIPYMQSPGRDDYDKAGHKCLVYDVIFHPDALSLAKGNAMLCQTLEQTALDAVEKSFNVVLDRNNIRRPKLSYKGLKTAVTVKYKVGESAPKILNVEELGNETPPQPDTDAASRSKPGKENPRLSTKKPEVDILNSPESDLKAKECSTGPVHRSSAKQIRSDEDPKQGWTVPKYYIKYRSHVDMQDFCLDSQRDGSSSKPIPEEIILTIDLPLLRDSTGLDADVVEDGWRFELKSEKQAAYRLELGLPFQVDDMKSKASFDKDTRKLTISLKTILQYSKSTIRNIHKDDHVHDTSDSESETVPSGKPVLDISLRPKSVPEDIPGRLAMKQDILSSSGDSTGVGSPSIKKTVRFSDDVQKKVYRSNSSILGQKKKNQRKAKNKRKSRERLNSGESISSIDDEDGSGNNRGRSIRERFNSGGSLSSMDDEEREKENDGEDPALETWRDMTESTDFPHLLV